VLVAHPDDETGGCAGLLQHLHEPTVVFATDGAPVDSYFWRDYGSPENYAQVRRQEAAAALAVAGVHQFEFLGSYFGPGTFLDQQLHQKLSNLFELVERMVRRYRPDCLLVPAYEGGHPDHDVCSFIGSVIGGRLKIPVWEMPLYHRSDQGELVSQRFRQTNGTEMAYSLSSAEARTREAMLACYRSQRDLADYVVEPVETIRPQAHYDYQQPPHSGIVNYRAWEWPISPVDVCRHFREYLDSPEGVSRSRPGDSMGLHCMVASSERSADGYPTA
jgi:LmbE family N-acetylglucosaminyl deacetylase